MYVLVLAALTHTLVVAMPVMCLPVLFKEISNDLNLSLVQIGIIWGIGALPGIFIGLIGGPIGDRFGTRRTLTVACVLVGTAGALRGFADSFVSLGATIVLFGLLSPVVPINVHKTCGVWFPKRQLGLANGVVAMGMALGFMAGSLMSATVLSPWLGGWRNVLLFYGIISMAVSIPWYLSRPAPGDRKSTADESDTRSFRRTVPHIIGIKNVWLLGLTGIGISGCVQGTLGYLPLYLRGIGWPEASADGTLATFHALSMIGAIPLALWSDRFGSRKKVLMIAALMIITGSGLLSMAEGMMVWVAVIIAGWVRDGFMAIFMTMIIETRGVGATFAGTALGLVMVLLGLGNLIAPPLSNSLAAVVPGLPFVFWATLAAAGFFGLYFTKEGAAENTPISRQFSQMPPS
ncbi:MAG: MFS transporter [Anaerolineae bacterium]|nr:MFS transporter [Anaerolineae bacterium]